MVLSQLHQPKGPLEMKSLRFHTVLILAILLATILIGAFVESISATDDIAPLRPVRTTHLYIAITVWSDGSIDTAAPIQLDHRSARRLADRLTRAEEANAERESKAQEAAAAEAELSKAAGDGRASKMGDATRCTADASSTGKRCRKLTRSLGGLCSVHRD